MSRAGFAIPLVVVLVAGCGGGHKAQTTTQQTTVTSSSPQVSATPGHPLTLPASVPQDRSPNTVAVDSNGTVYVGVGQPKRGGFGPNCDVAEFDAQGNFVRVFHAHLIGNNPYVAVGPDHNVYVWAASNFEPIREYSPAGKLLRTLHPPSTIRSFDDLEVDGSGNIFATGYDNAGSTYKVFRFAHSGHETAAFAVGAAGDPLSGLAVDADGTLWVVRQSGRSVLLHVDASGHKLATKIRLDAAGQSVKFDDVDFVGGKLWAIGHGDPSLAAPALRNKIVVAAFNPDGSLAGKYVGDQLANYCCPGETYSLAVRGSGVFATGLRPPGVSADRIRVARLTWQGSGS